MKVVLFGIGKNFIDFWSKTDNINHIEVVGVSDNDESKWGKTYCNYVVEAPDVVMKQPFDKVMIFPDAFEEIQQQLFERYSIPINKTMRPTDAIILPSVANLGSIELDCDYDTCYDVNDLIPDKIIANNRLEEFFFFEEHRTIWKWWHYFEIYHTYFQQYAGKKITMLEIGVYKGGSLQMWKDYFGEQATIVGIDINPECKAFEEDHVHVCIGSQDDPDFLKAVSEEYGPFDIILDDGSHMVNHQRISFETLFPLLKDGGLYLCEDMHTSYWDIFGGKLHDKSTFVEYSKDFIDYLHEQHIYNEPTFPEPARYIKACHYYDSMIVIEKKFRGISLTTMSGND